MADTKRRKSIFADGKLPERYLEFRPAIQAAAKKHNIPEAVLWGLLHKESSGRKDIGVGGDKHGHGPFQIDDRSHSKWLAKNNPHDMSQAADYAAQIMAENSRRLGGKMDRAVAAYNAGVGGVRKGLRAGKTLDQITFKPNYASGVMGSGDEILSLLPPEEQGVGGSGFPPGPVTQEAPNWEELLGRYAPQTAAAAPQQVSSMGLGVSTNPLLMAMQSIKASAKEKPLDVGESTVSNEAPPLEAQADPTTGEQVVTIKSPRRQLREMQAAQAAPPQPVETRDDNSMLRILKTMALPTAPESDEPDNKNPYTASRK